MDLSVVLPVRNGGELLARQLDGLCQQRFDGAWEVIVSDNGSTDSTKAVVAAYSNRLQGLRLVDSKNYPGRSGAINEAVSYARSDRIATCDHDDLVGRDWAFSMASALECDDIVAGNVALTSEPLSWNGSVYSNFPDRAPSHGGFLSYAMGCNMGLRRDLLTSLGGFDSSMNGAEDIDLSWRPQVMGVRLGFALQARVLKGRRVTISERFRQHRSYGRMDVKLVGRFGVYGYHGLGSRTVKQALLVGVRCPQAVLSRRERIELAGIAGQVVGVSEQSLKSRLARSGR